MGVVFPLEDLSTTHGMCPRCFERMRREQLGPRPHVLIVVRHNQAAMRQHLLNAFHGLPGVAVVPDRRQGERRAVRTSRPDERRKRDRRLPLFSQRDPWLALGVQVIPVSRHESVG